MRVVYPGHVYELHHVGDPNLFQTLHFVQKAPLHPEMDGILNQEVLRVLINRVQFLEKEVHYDRNDEIIFHLRAALLLHEVRALGRKFCKGDFAPESIVIGSDGHFYLERSV